MLDTVLPDTPSQMSADPVLHHLLLAEDKALVQLSQPDPGQLTALEKLILAGITQDFTAYQISMRTELKLTTVRMMVRTIMKQLEARDLSQLKSASQAFTLPKFSAQI
ncbi:MAG: LuxR C-terminal-related transcriptional regulator [Pseudomonadota bacterium]